MVVKEKIRINAAPEQVFSYMMEVQNRTQYIPMLEEVILLDDPPLQQGSRYIEVASIAGQDLKTTYQVLSIQHLLEDIIVSVNCPAWYTHLTGYQLVPYASTEVHQMTVIDNLVYQCGVCPEKYYTTSQRQNIMYFSTDFHYLVKQLPFLNFR